MIYKQSYLWGETTKKMTFKEFSNIVKVCKQFIKYINNIINRLIEEYEYYKIEIENDDYDDNDLIAIIKGTLNITEYKHLKVYFKAYNEFLKNHYSNNYLYMDIFDLNILDRFKSKFKVNPNVLKFDYWVNSYRPLKHAYDEGENLNIKPLVLLYSYIKEL